MERTTDFPCLLLQLLIEFPRKPKRQRHFRGLFFCHPLTSSLPRGCRVTTRSRLLLPSCRGIMGRRKGVLLMGYTRESCERLVMSADKDGKIAFAQIRKIFPDRKDDFFYDLIGDSFRKDYACGIDTRTMRAGFYDSVMLFWENCPDDYKDGYIFKDTDTFDLSVPAENLRYECEHRRRNERLAKTAAISGIIAAIASVIALLR